MKTKIYAFEDNNITFILDKDNRVMVNATEMAKAFDKDLYQFTKSDHAKEFIKSCNKPANAGLLGIKSGEDLIVSRQKSGTFMHRVLALKFAAWLNSDFEFWVYTTIDRLLFGKYVEREQSLERTIALQHEQNALSDKADKTGRDFERYLAIGADLRKERLVRKRLTCDSIGEMKDLFEDEDV
jgi:hypothetical protein